jgi:hypothetical protein
MRPRIGKVPHWDKVTPSEQKKLDEKAKKYMVVKYLHQWNDPAHWDTQSRWCYEPVVDDPNLRWSINRHPNAEIVLEKLNLRDAVMWAKMMN